MKQNTGNYNEIGCASLAQYQRQEAEKNVKSAVKWIKVGLIALTALIAVNFLTGCDSGSVQSVVNSVNINPVCAVSAPGQSKPFGCP